jgi:virulence factor Mce-like protein
MNKGAPTIGKIVTMVLFALSCFGLLLFLWLSFGGPVPFKPQGYRVKISFPFADQLAQQADVRISGVSVGKVIDKSLDPHGNRTIGTLEIENQYAPLRADTRAILRIKTILGETYVELTPGTRGAPALPDGALLPRTQVVQAVQLDNIFNALDPTTRAAFQVWQQSLAQAVAGNAQGLSDAIGNLPRFAADASDITRVLDIEHQSVVRLLQNGSSVFAALSQNQAALQNLIRTGETTFATTAAQNRALEQTFRTFPTFLNETKATMTRLKSFALDTDPLLGPLQQVAAQLTPTLRSARQLAPPLQHFFTQLGPLIRVSKTGLPAVASVLDGAKPLLGQLGPFLEQLNPILGWLSLHQQLVSDFISNGAYALSGITTSFAGNGTGHYLRQFQPTGLETLGLFPVRTPTNRGNTYPLPLWAGDPKNLATGMFGNWDCNNTGAPGDGTIAADPAPLVGHPACWVAAPAGNLLGQPQKFPQVRAATYSSK